MSPEALQAFKKRHGLTNPDLARALGLPVYAGRNGSPIAPTISQWLTGKNRPPPYLWRALAHWAANKQEEAPGE